jgi:hypothetical protein
MENRGSTFGVLILVLLVVMLVGLLYLLYLNWPSEPIVLTKVNNQKNEEIQYSSSNQFYESMRYKDRIIRYNIASSCGEDRTESMLEAFSALENVTVLKFIQDQVNPELNILCSDVSPEAGQEDYFVAGEGGPSEVVNTSLYSVILGGKIALYRPDRCPESKIAVHELLHALGFDHNDNPDSILYPTLDCSQKIDEEIINDINRLYSWDSLPDLSVFSINASKGGRYLNFIVEVLNQGLVDVSNSSMTVYAGDKKVKDFDLEEIKIGARKILTVENLKLPLSSSQVSFVVDDSNVIPELFEGNNQVDLVLIEK